MKFDQIECFLKLSETLSFSETGLFLGLTQPSITRKIQALEEALQTTLFIRTKHSVKLTGSGQDFLKNIKPLHQEWNEILNHTQDQQNQLSGPLRIGVLPEIGKNFFFSHLLEFQNTHPALDLQVYYGLNHETLPQLMEGKLDFVIVNQLPESELYRSYKIMQEKAVMVTRTKKKVTKAEIIQQPFVAYSPYDGLLNAYLKSFYRPMDISKVENISCVNDHASMIQLLLQKDSLAVMPWFSIEKHLKSGTLMRADSHEKLSAFYLVELNKSRRSKKEQEFRTFLLKLKIK